MGKMFSISNLTVKTKLIISNIVPVAALILLLISAIGIMDQINDGVDSLYSKRVVPLKQLKYISDMYGVNIVNTSHKVRNGSVDWEVGVKNVDQATMAIQETWEAFLAHPLVEEEQQLVDAALPQMEQAGKGIAELRSIMVDMDIYSLADYIDQNLYPNIEPVTETVGKLVEMQLVLAEQESNTTTVLYDTSTSWFIVAAIVVIAIIVFVSLLIYKSIANPMGKLLSTIEHIERDSNLTLQVDIHSSDEIGKTAQAFDRMMGKVKQMVGDITAATSQLTSAAEHMSATSAEGLQAINDQQSQTDQVATAINEMSATVQEVATSAVDASDAAQEADGLAGNGRDVVSKTVNSIQDLAGEVQRAAEVVHRLETDVENIGGVLDVIRGIAEQTNLLALNAAIEAARAGEQGRGFAVVADEVRSLAQRTQESTREIQTMIERLQSGTDDAVKAMEQGRERGEQSVEQAQEAGTALAAITNAVGTIRDKNTQIAAAAEEQSTVAEEINRSIVSIKSSTERTAEVSNQTAGSSDELARLANELQQTVSQFQV